jgi:hypothetical protein
VHLWKKGHEDGWMLLIYHRIFFCHGRAAGFFSKKKPAQWQAL